MRRIVHALRWRAAVLMLVVAAGCTEKKDAVAPASPSIAGRWKGSAYLGTVQFEATFTQSGETVGGTGQVSEPRGSDNFTISGTVRGQEVLLTLITSENRMSGYTGRFTGANTIQGVLNPPDAELKIERVR